MTFHSAILTLLIAPLASSEDLSTCKHVVVVHDLVGDHWYSGCDKLDPKDLLTTEAACEAACKADQTCSVWMMTKKSDGTPLACKQGSVTKGCQSGEGDKAAWTAKLLGGQRIQHGEVDLVSNNKPTVAAGTWYKGLKFMKERVDTNESQKISRCKSFCYTDVSCTVWQYGKSGCFVEHVPDFSIKAENMVTTGDLATNMIAGETIKHTCPVDPPKEGLPWTWIILGAVLAAVALAGILYMLLKPKPVVKKTRAVKMKEAPAAAPVAMAPITYSYVSVPQSYAPLAPQQSVVMTAQPAPMTMTTQPAQMTTMQYQMPAAQPMVGYGI